MADMYAVSEQALTDIADAIRLKRDITTPLTVDDMALEISLIDGGGSGGRLVTIEKLVTPETDLTLMSITTDIPYNLDLRDKITIARVLENTSEAPPNKMREIDFGRLWNQGRISWSQMYYNAAGYNVSAALPATFAATGCGIVNVGGKTRFDFGSTNNAKYPAGDEYKVTIQYFMER